MKKFKTVAALLLALSVMLSTGCSIEDIFSGSSSGRSRHRHEDEEEEDEYEDETERTSQSDDETEEPETSETSATSDKEPPATETTAAETTQTSASSEVTEATEEPGSPIYEGTFCDQEFGSYYVTHDFVVVPAQSMAPDTFTYCLSGHENDSTPPNNIVVRHGDNYYSPEEHETFCAAILQQVTGQAAEFGGTAHMDETFMVNGTRVYKFVLDCTPYTEQWYFCGDHEFVMIGMSIFDEDESQNDQIREVADDILWSFEWAE